MKRRSVLKTGVVAALGTTTTGCLSMVPQQLKGAVDDATGPPDTESKLASIDIAGNQINKLVFYESGAVNLHFTTSHDFDRFGVAHISNQVKSNAIKTWSAPEYQGPKTINLKRVIENNGPYPNNAFHIDRMHNILSSTVEFKAPPSWYPD